MIILEQDPACGIGEVHEHAPIGVGPRLHVPRVGDLDLAVVEVNDPLDCGRDRQGFGLGVGRRVEVRRDIVVVQGSTQADVVEDIVRSLVDVVAVLAV